ncbi:MAG: EI24 domain-containing protein [Bacteroidetes bacterium]|nr:EI24 domain-containing protein [Bacteroidota bacterium]
MVKNFLDGISSYGAAFRHVSKHGLWGYVLLPGLLSLAIGIGVFALAWGFSDNVGNLLDNLWRWDWGRAWVEKIAQVFGGLLLLLMGMIMFKQIIMVVSAPAMSILSEKVENQLLGIDGGTKLSIPQILSDLQRGLRIALRNIVREVFLTIILLLAGLIPLLTPFTTALIFVLQAYYAGFGNIDFALERHFRYRDSVRFVQNNRALAIGNGTVFLLLLFTFVGFLFALPLGTVAATIETTKRLERHG